MKILHLSRRFYPHLGGVETHVYEISKILIKRRHKVSIITQQFSQKEQLEETIEGITIYRIPLICNEDKWKTWLWMWQHRQLFIGAHKIHIHDVFWWTLPLLPLIQKNLYITFHGYEGNEAPNVNKRFWHQAAAFVTQANLCIGGFHEKWYGVKPTMVSFGAASTNKKIHSKNKNNIIFIGRLEHDNGIIEYINAMLLLQKNNFILDVYGDGSLKDECEDIVKKYKLPVIFHGFVDNAAQYLSDYSIAFVSRYLAIVEALQIGNTVIAHYNNEIKKDYLMLSPFSNWISIVGTSNEISKAVQKEKRLPEMSRKWAEAQTWDKMVDGYEKLWQTKK